MRPKLRYDCTAKSSETDFRSKCSRCKVLKSAQSSKSYRNQTLAAFGFRLSALIQRSRGGILRGIRSYTAWLSVLLLVIPFFLWPVHSMAIQELIPKLSLDLTYDDNINFSYTLSQRDWIYEIRPSLSWRYRTERDILDVRAGLHGQKYNTEDDLDTLDQDYRLYASREVFYGTIVSLRGRYTLDTTLDDEFTEEGLLLYREDRTVYSLEPAVQWQATERSTWTFSAPIYHVNYEGDENVDYSSEYLILNYSYLLNDEKTSLLTQPSIGFVNSEHVDTKVYQMMFGVGREFTERLFAELMAGFSYTRSHIDERFEKVGSIPIKVQDEENFDKTGWVATGELKWDWDKGQWEMNFVRRVSPSGYGQILIKDRLTTGASWRITERMRFKGKLSAGKVKSQDNKEFENYDYVTYDISPAIVYRLSERIDVGAYYRYSIIDDKEESEIKHRNQFFIRLDYKGP
ncbi:MAG: hypothetical protein JRF20_08695 [Deltaproteobacteria bacterium]|nr:hypothetical protein [Deltaproteobacteria bacterium]MBW1937682.1 hypothetical protein [Deltaproteobacteria bacterium]MBW1964232.1 hypothetical protein [Deltaproteobacteria bacterium]MBW2079992.1 hypothetical protein [Deltaproteobacteria bacterium]MBW2351248.1 hypothetical protein [Deltaproteobacteria bacterium]